MKTEKQNGRELLVFPAVLFDRGRNNGDSGAVLQLS